MESEVYNEDCIIGMSRYPNNFFNLAIVDPPYGIGRDKQIDFGTTTRVKHMTKEWDCKIPTPEYFIELFRVSVNQIIWGGNYFIENLYNTKSFIVWDKMNGGNNMADCELAWTSFDMPIRLIRRHIFSGVGNTNYTTIHPTQKPVQLYKWILQKYAKSGDRIIDTHLGSGSSRIACYDGGFDFYGWEIDKEYFDAMDNRFRTHIQQLTLSL